MNKHIGSSFEDMLKEEGIFEVMTGKATERVEAWHARQFQPNDKVVYVPMHANGDRNHPDCERGIVSSVGEMLVYVRFNKQIASLGWDGTTSQGCDPDSLIKEEV